MLVALCGLTSVNANGASPQSDTLIVADMLLPTCCWPKSSVSALMQMRDAASAVEQTAAKTTGTKRAKARSDCMAARDAHR
ncbi:MAG TPA: hypothetical protein VN858_05065 [Casimicrobiaceae bacterium]|nr:hypothetical protein [Casimicrobiaceae bacterium]